MIKVYELRKSIGTILKTLHDRVFFESAPDDAIFPYVVYDLPNSIDSGTLENFVLDIDVWDDDENTIPIETLIGTIDNELHKKSVIVDDKLAFTLYRNNRFTLKDNDPRITRRKYVYQARTYQKYYKQ